MSGPVFTIEVGEKKVGCRIEPGGETIEPEDLTYTASDLKTVTVLEKWLQRWEWIAGLEKCAVRDPSGPPVRRSLLVPDTFQVLGTLLWNLLLRGTVGDMLITEYDRVRQDGDGALRVLVSFGNEAAAGKLAGLPWEFLYYPGTASRGGFFLATEAELVLSRYLQGRKRPGPPEATRLRVVFWVTLPDSPEFDAERVGCERTRTALGTKYREVLDTPEPIIGWRPTEVVAHLGGDADVVHVVGVARPRDEGTTVELRVSVGEVDRWIDSTTLVDALTRDPRKRPELVVLHLCDWPGSDDASENFERLAPMLIKKDVPAVLAMRYPMAPGDADGFICEFYERLIEGDGDIGLAVQNGRFALQQQDGESRRFGVPVLYLQRTDGLLLTDRTHRPRTTGGLPSTTTALADTGTLGQRIRTTLLDVAGYESPDPDSAVALRAWITDTPWPDDRDQAWTIIKARSRDQVHDDRLRPVFGKLMSAVLEEL